MCPDRPHEAMQGLARVILVCSYRYCLICHIVKPRQREHARGRGCWACACLACFQTESVSLKYALRACAGSTSPHMPTFCLNVLYVLHLKHLCCSFVALKGDRRTLRFNHACECVVRTQTGVNPAFPLLSKPGPQASMKFQVHLKGC